MKIISRKHENFSSGYFIIISILEFFGYLWRSGSVSKEKSFSINIHKYLYSRKYRIWVKSEDFFKLERYYVMKTINVGLLAKSGRDKL